MTKLTVSRIIPKRKHFCSIPVFWTGTFSEKSCRGSDCLSSPTGKTTWRKLKTPVLIVSTGSLLLDQQNYLVSILNRQDKMSMAASIESRVPLLDYRIVELANRMPSHYKMKYFKNKMILKGVARDGLRAKSSTGKIRVRGAHGNVVQGASRNGKVVEGIGRRFKRN